MSYPLQQPAGYGASGMLPVDYRLDPRVPAPRPLWKTWLFSILLSLIPFVGSSIAVIYVYTRKRPDAFDGGKAFGATMVYALYLIIPVVIVAAIVWIM